MGKSSEKDHCSSITMSAEFSMMKKAESMWWKEERYQNLPCLSMLVDCASLLITLEFPHNHNITADFFFSFWYW